MINIYNKKELEFNSNGLAVLNECSKCIITEKLNNEYELNMSYPLHSTKSGYLKPFNVIKADGQLFRIYNVESDSKTDSINVSARHIFYDLLNYVVDSVILYDVSCSQAVITLMEALNLSGVYTISSNIKTKNDLILMFKSGVEALFNIVDMWDGEVVRDNFNIEINASKDTNRGVTIKYGKNIIGINEIINCDNVVTKIYPIGANDLTLPDKYILSDGWDTNKYPEFAIAKKVEFKDAQNVDQLEAMANDYLSKNSIPYINYKIDFLKLSHTSEYKDYKVLEQIEVGDIVEVIHSDLYIDIKVKVISIVKDILSDKNTKVELGQPIDTLGQFLTKILNNAK